MTDCLQTVRNYMSNQRNKQYEPSILHKRYPVKAKKASIVTLMRWDDNAELFIPILASDVDLNYLADLVTHIGFMDISSERSILMRSVSGSVFEGTAYLY